MKKFYYNNEDYVKWPISIIYYNTLVFQKNKWVQYCKGVHIEKNDVLILEYK